MPRNGQEPAKSSATQQNGVVNQMRKRSRAQYDEANYQYKTNQKENHVNRNGSFGKQEIELKAKIPQVGVKQPKTRVFSSEERSATEENGLNYKSLPTKRRRVTSTVNLSPSQNKGKNQKSQQQNGSQDTAKNLRPTTAQKQPKSSMATQNVSMLNKYFSENPADKLSQKEIRQLLSVYINSSFEVAHQKQTEKGDIRIGKILQHEQDGSEKGVRKARVRLESLRLGFGGQHGMELAVNQLVDFSNLGPLQKKRYDPKAKLRFVRRIEVWLSSPDVPEKLEGCNEMNYETTINLIIICEAVINKEHFDSKTKIALNQISKLGNQDQKKKPAAIQHLLALNFDKENNKIELEKLCHFWQMLFPAKFTDVQANGTIFLKYGYDHENPEKLYSVSPMGIKQLALQQNGVKFASAQKEPKSLQTEKVAPKPSRFEQRPVAKISLKEPASRTQKRQVSHDSVSLGSVDGEITGIRRMETRKNRGSFVEKTFQTDDEHSAASPLKELSAKKRENGAHITIGVNKKTMEITARRSESEESLRPLRQMRTRKRKTLSESSSDLQKSDKDSEKKPTKITVKKMEQSSVTSSDKLDVSSSSKRSSSRSQSSNRSSSQNVVRGRRGRPQAKGNSTIIEESKEESSGQKSSSDCLDKSENSESSEEKADVASDEAEKMIYIQSRNRSKKKLNGQDVYEQACQSLQLNAIPDELPCRDDERKNITTFLTTALKQGGNSSSLYISGMPGTGKTVTTLQVIAKLRKQINFDFLHINAMSLTNPNLVYTIIHEKITQRRVNPATAALFLDEFFKKKDKVKLLQSAMPASKKKNQKLVQQEAKKIRVVLIDELDALLTKKQTLLYNLFDWPCHENSRLVVVAIANTMDLPERMQQKIASRIGSQRLVYEPYNKEQIAQILLSRIKDISDIFENQSVKLVATKVSKYSGDIRRSLQITKRAVEIVRFKYEKECEKQNKTLPLIKVKLQDVLTAFEELFQSKTVKVLQALKKFEVIFMLALHIELTLTKSERIAADHVQDRCNTLLRTHLGWQTKIQNSVYMQIVKRMQAFGLINLQVEHNKIIDNTHLMLSVFKDELANAFKDKDFVVKQLMGEHNIQNLLKDVIDNDIERAQNDQDV